MDDTAPSRRAGRFDWERALLAAPEVSGTRIGVLLGLGTYMSKTGANAYPGQARLAAELGMGIRTVGRDLAWAVEHGYLVRTGNCRREGVATGRLATVYAAAIPAPHAGINGAIPADAAGIDNPVTGTGEPPYRHTDAALPARPAAQQPETNHPHHQVGGDELIPSIPIDSADAAEQRERADEPSLVDRVRAARPPGAPVLAWTDPRVLAARAEAISSGVPEHRVDDVLVALAGDPEVEYPSAVRHRDSLKRARAQVAGASREASTMPEWCGQCDSNTRMRDYYGDKPPYRCPDCKPGRAA